MSLVSDISEMFLTDLGAPTSPGNVQAVSVWLNAENSNPTLRNNPWNLHSPGGLPGQTGSVYVNKNDQDVAVFGSIEAGVQASANNLEVLAHTYPDYGTAIAALRADNPTGFLNAIAHSPWSASGYGLRVQTPSGKWVPSPNPVNRLLVAYNAAGGPDTSGTAAGQGAGTTGSVGDQGAASIAGLGGGGASKGSTSPLDPFNLINDLSIAFPQLKGLAVLGDTLGAIAVNGIALIIGLFLVIIGLWTLVKGSPPDIAEAIAAGLGAALGPEGAAASAARAQPSGTSARGALGDQTMVQQQAQAIQINANSVAGGGQATEYSPETPRARRPGPRIVSPPQIEAGAA